MQKKNPKTLLWQKIPDFEDTCVTYASLAGHVVNIVCVDKFDDFLNSL